MAVKFPGCQRLPGMSVAMVLIGTPFLEIIRQVLRQKHDLVIMGTVCRTGVAGFFIGNTAENVLQKVDCSVLTVKPEDFVSPAKLKAASSSANAV